MHLLLMGGGKMGNAMLKGWINQGIVPAAITVIEPDRDAAHGLEKTHKVCVYPTLEQAEQVKTPPQCVILALKPQVMDTIMQPLSAPFYADSLFISIAAGLPIRYFTEQLGGAVVRAMPNTPAAIGHGITVACPSATVSPDQRAQAHELLSAVGVVEWSDDEGVMDAVTALSGGGPAYVSLLVESLAKAGEEAGLPPALSMRLARRTVCGSGVLIHHSTDPVQTLRTNVTSPGGTTAEALKVLMDPAHGWQPILTRAIAAATHRSKKLAEDLGQKSTKEPDTP